MRVEAQPAIVPLQFISVLRNACFMRVEAYTSLMTLANHLSAFQHENLAVPTLCIGEVAIAVAVAFCRKSAQPFSVFFDGRATCGDLCAIGHFLQSPQRNGQRNGNKLRTYRRTNKQTNKQTNRQTDQTQCSCRVRACQNLS